MHKDGVATLIFGDQVDLVGVRFLQSPHMPIMSEDTKIARWKMTLYTGQHKSLFGQKTSLLYILF